MSSPYLDTEEKKLRIVQVNGRHKTLQCRWRQRWWSNLLQFAGFPHLPPGLLHHLQEVRPFSQMLHECSDSSTQMPCKAAVLNLLLDGLKERTTAGSVVPPRRSTTALLQCCRPCPCTAMKTVVLRLWEPTERFLANQFKPCNILAQSNRQTCTRHVYSCHLQ